MIQRAPTLPLRVAVCSVALGIPVSGSLLGQEREAVQAPVIRTSGLGEVTLEPDRAVLEFGIQVRGPSADDLLTEVASIQSSVIDTLTSLGVSPDSLQVDQLHAWPRWTGEDRDRRDYQVAATIGFRTEALERIPGFIEAALAAGVSRSSGVRWESSMVDQARGEALRLALEAARRDAEALARAAGGRLGALIEVSAGGGPAVERFAMETAQLEPAARTAVGPVPQPVLVRQSIVASWRLEMP